MQLPSSQEHSQFSHSQSAPQQQVAAVAVSAPASVDAGFDVVHEAANSSNVAATVANNTRERMSFPSDQHKYKKIGNNGSMGSAIVFGNTWKGYGVAG